MVAEAVLHTAKVNEAAAPIDMPRLPRFDYPKSLADADLNRLEFKRDETPFVVHALASYARELSGHPILSHRAQSLIGCLIVQAGGSFVPTEAV